MTAAFALLAAAVFGQQVRTFYTTSDGLPSDDVQTVAAGPDGRMYARTSGGAARLDDGRWVPVAEVPRVNRTTVTLPTREGIPVADITSIAQSADGSYWVGTKSGALHYANGRWEYRQGLRWLPSDDIRDVAIAGTTAFFATTRGVGAIRTRPMTFAEKAKFFEDEIDKRHRRTEYGYVLGVGVRRPGDASEYTQTDSDNDGLWTSMYGASQCFACSVGVQGACERARRVFEALRFLGTVTRGGEHAAPKGFVARTVLPASGPDPNLHDSPERDERQRASADRLWKVMRPRWPKSADGKWYWKSDTSSDELDGHYFFYGLYYDLAATNDSEKQRVREHIAALTDHLAEHNYQLIDHDGKPTRWGIFNPENLNRNLAWWEERGLNSISILSYLRTAEHITGNSRYGDAARALIERHHYDMNALIPKGGGPGAGNQSDDEMAFMCLYNLLRYEKDARLRMIFGRALRDRWNIEQPELNPLFNFIAGSSLKDVFFEEPPQRHALALKGTWREEAVDTLRRFPLDRFNWAVKNSHRADVVRLPEWAGTRGGPRGHLRNGRVLPIDERFAEHWNHDPWRLDYEGDGRHLADGAAFLLPYYIGLYHGFIEQ